MSGVSPQLKELVLAYKSARRPSEAETARVLEGLRARLGDGAITGAESTQLAAKSTGLLTGKGLVVGLASFAVVGGIWFFASPNPRAASSVPNTPASAATTESAAVAVSQPEAMPPSAPTPPAPETSGVAADVPSPTPRSAPSHHVRDRLAEEVALLSRAQAAIRNGKPTVALDVLNEHERKFGNGLLSEERIAARVRALCALGRTSEADAQLARLSPKSLHGQSPQACGSRKSN
jgi:hypothetical protein